MAVMIERIPITQRGAWLELRRNDVTASEIAALFGIHPFRTHLEVYLAKTGMDGTRGDNKAMRRGRIIEPTVAAAVAEDNPEWSAALRKATDYFRRPDLRMGATPDYFIGDPDKPGCGVLECKTMAPEEFERWGEAPPLAYTLQVAAQMICTGAAWGSIAVMVMNRNLDLHCFPVPRVASAEQKLIDGVAAFWGRVERGEPPPPQMPADRATLAGMFKRDDGSEIDLSGDNALPALLEERATLKATISSQSKRTAEIEDEIKAKLGKASVATLAGWKITYKLQHRKEVLIPATDFRVLRVAKNGEPA